MSLHSGYPCQRTFFVVVAGSLLLTGLAHGQESIPQAKRPLKHADYDSWKSIQVPTLSRDGKYLAYNLMPADGDGELVVRNLETGTEHRIARGNITPPTAEGAAVPPAPSTPPTRPGRGQAVQPGATVAKSPPQFTPDVKSLVFPLVPTKAEIDKAKAEKKKPEEMPRTVLAIMDLATGKIGGRIEHVSSFTVGGSGAGLLVYKREVKPEDRPTEKPVEKPPTGDKPTAPRTPRVYGTDLVIRNLADGSEQTRADVTEFSLTRDGTTLVYAVASKKEETDGVYALTALPGTVQRTILSGKGRYSRLTWDEKQEQLAFLSDRDDASAEQPKFRIYRWERRATLPRPEAVARLPLSGAFPLNAVSALGSLETPTAAPVLVGPGTPGLKNGWIVSDRAALSFSQDGTRLYLGTAPEPPAPTPPTKPTEGAPTDDKVVLDLWHWKDEYIQPMQKARAAAEQNRTYRAMVSLKDNAFRQLSDETTELTMPQVGDWAVGADNHKYRFLTGYGPELSDYTLVNVRNGEKKPILEASHWSPSFSNSGQFTLYFDGKDWNSIAVATGKKSNLTAKLGVRFAVEDVDTPSEAPPYGVAGWSSDDRFVLIHDRYDVWQLPADGTEAKCLTAGLGRKTNTVLRLVRVPPSEGESRERGFDLTKPLLLKADNERTRDEGFYRLEPGAEPKLLVMGARSYGVPLKAKDANVYLLTISSFHDAPDYYITGSDYREFRKVTDANPQQKDFLWGNAELVRYKNLDGVELSGVLIKPEEFDPHKKYPMIVYIYERLSQNLHRFSAPSAGTSINPSYYASNGYLVFMPDIVYTVGSPGQSALKSVLPGIQSVVDKGYVDEKAIGIQGHSWGGYQIAYLVTQTTRFKAAIAGAPVSDMVSAYDGIRWGTGMPRQFQYERTQSRIGGTLWEKPSRFIENSPIFMADRVQTPLMMLHNDQDDAVPWYQGIEYYLALRRLGKECYLLNYNGEAHGLRKKANQRDWTVRMQQFFDYHLKGAPKPEWMEKGIPYLERDKEKEAVKAKG
jgi:dipeptidyl aminopeptidase/acylaminoacyl peptidase